ncbi:hypothetical protein JXI42_13600 [bacterium]|nr:hypothetical protein [bacterium]
MVSALTIADWSGFTDDLLEETPAFGQFNHPDDTDYPLLWNFFAYVSPEVDSAFPLIEIKNIAADPYYAMALDSGWHVSAVSNQDNHDPDWGTKNDSRAGIWATELTRPALFEAIKARRTFSTQDKNVACWIDLNDTDMGSSTPRNHRMRLHISFEDEDMETFSTIEVRGGNSVIFCELNNKPSPFDTTLSITPYYSKWIYVYAQQLDGDRIWSGPVFLTGEPLSITENRVLNRILKISPNPASMRLQFADLKFFAEEPEFFDISGRSVKEFTRRINSNSYDISNLPVGTYIVLLGKYSEKIVILR